MNQRTHTLVLAFGAACFVATVLGVPLYLHLAHDKEPAKHDVAHCLFCQQFLVGKKKYIVEIESATIEVHSAGYVIAIWPAFAHQQAAPHACHPRPPPRSAV